MLITILQFGFTVNTATLASCRVCYSDFEEAGILGAQHEAPNGFEPQTP